MPVDSGMAGIDLLLRPLGVGAVGVACMQAGACRSNTSAYHPVVGCLSTDAASAAAPHGLTWPMFHGDRARTGWNAEESILTPTALSTRSLVLAWESPRFDEALVGDTIYGSHAYASPLYADDMPIEACGGSRLSVVFAATSNGYAYAVNAFDTSVGGGSVPAGTLLWRAALAPAVVVPRLDARHAPGTLSTPVLDLQATPLGST